MRKTKIQLFNIMCRIEYLIYPFWCFPYESRLYTCFVWESGIRKSMVYHHAFHTNCNFMDILEVQTHNIYNIHWLHPLWSRNDLWRSYPHLTFHPNFVLKEIWVLGTLFWPEISKTSLFSASPFARTKNCWLNHFISMFFEARKS